jgi:hypothetical protein
MRLACLASVAVLVLSAGVSRAEDTVDNPEFTTWSKFKKGTSITLKTTSAFNNMTTEITSTTTLVEVGADKLVVETSSVTKFNNMEIKAPPAKRDVMKTITLPKGVKKEDLTAKKPPGTFEEGTETVKVGGTEVKTKWFKFKAEMDGTKTEAKMWTSDDVPGSMVKMESTTTGKVATTLKMELVEFKKP